MPELAAIALGSNLGDKRAVLRSALASLARLPRSTLLAASSFHVTKPVMPGSSAEPQPDYLNAAAVLRTGLAPRELLDHLLEIEREHGRTRTPGLRWEPRTLDLDLLLVGSVQYDEPGLRLPHPRLHERAFVLVPLAEVLPDAIVPVLGVSVRDLRALARSRI